MRVLDKLSTREKLIYDQCIMKANAKSPKAARYKKTWIYDCLLLKIKSTVVYTFLHENEYLPLPNPRTLYTYLRSLKADFGFDSSLFTVLKDKLQVLPERERRGVLMFDEMSARKSVHIRESDMTLLGKVNFAEHTRPSDSLRSLANDCNFSTAADTMTQDQILHGLRHPDLFWSFIQMGDVFTIHLAFEHAKEEKRLDRTLQ
ncbi:hypothetical protein MRX96_056953 [Rhipicephalus microplus]